jgi:predicted RNase H-like nuclease
MGLYVGADWAGTGWFAVLRRDDDWTAGFYPTIWSLWKYHSDADRILVDIPIGLPSVDQGRRRCDEAAKAYLSERHRSVFYTPVRDAVYEPNLDDAKTINERAGYSIQNQAWAIVPRIRELDEFLDSYPGARDRLRETHPEVCFRALKGDPLAHGKRTDAGVTERLDLLTAEHPELASVYETVRETYATPAYAPRVSGRDDVLDAMVAAVTAARGEQELETLPDVPPTDARGLPMEIVYPTAAVQTTLADL